MIIESIFSTLDAVGQPNFAPMGVRWGDEMITVRPFRDTSTYRNLLASGYGVVNITDDVRAFVQSGLYGAGLPYFPATAIPGVVFERVCYWREVQMLFDDGSEIRAEIHCRVIASGWRRDFLGFCRAHGAILEAAILATRLNNYSPNQVSEALAGYEDIVNKTGGEAELNALQEVKEYIERRLNEGHR
jgi:hypothetical protein